MFDFAIELITLAASNSLAIFCFCNLIIVILLLVGSKPNSEFGHQDSPIPPPTVDHRNKNHKEGTNTAFPMENSHASAEVDEIEMVSEEKVDHNEEEEEGEEEEDDDDDDDELRRRVEQFIEKINTEWKAEKLRTSLLV